MALCGAPEFLYISVKRRNKIKAIKQDERKKTLRLGKNAVRENCQSYLPCEL